MTAGKEPATFKTENEKRMKASEARKLTHDHSKRMKEIYKQIESSAKMGHSQAWIIGTTTQEEIRVLRDNGFDANYEVSETDGGQAVVVKW